MSSDHDPFTAPVEKMILERDLALAQRRIVEMIAEIDSRDELISDLQRRIEFLEKELAEKSKLIDR